MSPLEPLAPDQRAVVALVLQQRRSYDEIAALLGMPADAVRARAHAGLASLARDNGLPGEVTGPLADYLLGQQRAADAEATRSLLADSAPARAWATDVAERLADVAPDRLPEIPRAPPDAAAPPGPRPRPVREAPPPAPKDDDSPPAASRLGGALLIAGVLAVVAVVLVLVLSGGDDDPADEQAATSPTPTATAPAAAPDPVATIPLRSTTGGMATGTMSLYLQDGQLLFALAAQDVPPSGERASYAVWFTGPGAKARRLGFTNPVGADGRLGIQGPSDKDLAAFPKIYATHERVVVSEETREDAKRPGKTVLSGRLPRGR